MLQLRITTKRQRQRQHTPKSPNIRGVKTGTPRMFGDLGVCAVIRKPPFVQHVPDQYKNLVILSDDLPFFPVYNPAPLLRNQASRLIQAEAPGVVQQLACISQALDNATMAELNRQVSIYGQESQQVWSYAGQPGSNNLPL